MTSDRLFAAEPFEQFPGQLSMEQLETPIVWSVRVQLFSAERGPQCLHMVPSELRTIRCNARSADEARERVERHTWTHYGEVLTVEAER